MAFRPPPSPSASRSEKTAALIARKGTDLERWSQPESLASQWDERAALAASLITEPGRVLDVGAGAMALKGFLAAGATYVPADVVKRSEDCLVADLNKAEFPDGAYDYVSFLGVLEYVHDPAWALRAAARAAPKLVASYCADTAGDIAYRRGLGWVNDFTKRDFEALLAKAWVPQACLPYKRSASNDQYVWKCVRREDL